MIRTRFITASIAAVSMTLAMPAFAMSFSDVPDSHTSAEAVAYVKAEGIVGGYPDGTFKPDQTINRAEFTKIIMGSAYEMGKITACEKPVEFFADVPEGAWFFSFVCHAKNEGVIGGYPDGTFKPDATINYAEAAKIMANAYGIEVDTAADGEWFAPFINALVKMEALPPSYKSADALVKRGEMAQMIYLVAIAEGVVQVEEEKTQTVGAGCKVAGCSSQLCVSEDSEDIMTTCEWTEVYGCYESATCEMQGEECGWNMTKELSSCIEDATLEMDVQIKEGSYVEYNEEVIAKLGGEVVLFFYAGWCPYCQEDDKFLTDLYTEAQGKSVVKVNYDTELDLKAKYGVVQQHTYVHIDAEGNAIATLVGPTDEELMALVK